MHLAMFMGDKMKLAGEFSILFPLVIFVINLLLEKAYRNTKWFRISMLVLYVGGILYLTVLRREIGTVHQIQLQPFWSYAKFDDPQYRWQIYMNVFLFIPFGFMLGWALNCRFLQALLIGLVFSAFLETVQYFFCLGLCEIDDVLHNTLGTVIGFEYWRMLRGLCSQNIKKI